ncbi:7336_t:CDS:10 [Entrophospora sp. SA101]|nr:7336_t:CDS:10 [Entrophospora sp. SA101]
MVKKNRTCECCGYTCATPQKLHEHLKRKNPCRSQNFIPVQVPMAEPEIITSFTHTEPFPVKNLNDRNPGETVKNGAQDFTGVPSKKAAGLVEHPFSRTKAYILTLGNEHFRTDDRGKTWVRFTTETPPARLAQVLSFHAERENYILFRGTRCKKWEYGFETSPKLLATDTDSCLWAVSTKGFGAPEKAIFCKQYTGSNDAIRKFSDFKLVMFENFLESTPTPVDFDTGHDVSGVIGLAARQKFLIVAVKNPNTFDMAMYVTNDGKKWIKALFPLNAGFKENAYTILESPTDHLVVDVLSDESTTVGTLFSSNSDGNYFINRLNHTNRNKDGSVDFEKVQSVGGIFLVNVVGNYKDVNRDSFIAKQVKSMISFEDGSTWNFIKPPERDFRGDKFHCDIGENKNWKTGDCSLHLHSFTSPHNYGYVYSSAAAPGVLMGVGNVGPYLLPYDQCDTFLSYDGGLTWSIARPGAHKYEIGDSGALLVIVDDEQPTDHVLYSYNRGKTWQQLDLGMKVHARMLTTDPESTTQKFILLGTFASDHQDGGTARFRHFIFQLDFQNLFSRKCEMGNGNDYEKWTARKLENGPDCLMGHTSEYYRKKEDADCYVGRKYEDLTVEEKPCPCTDEDYECDFHFTLDPVSNTCVRSGPHYLKPDECRPGSASQTYEDSSGYRLIPGNTCDSSLPNAIKKDEAVVKSCDKSDAIYIPGEIYHKTINQEFESSFFYFPDSTVIIAKTTTGQVLRSADEGLNWAPIDKLGKVTYMYPHDLDTKRAYFFTEDDKLYWTKDLGETISQIENLPIKPNKLGLQLLDFHPKEADWLLFVGGTDCPSPNCHSEAHYSPDNGATWKLVETWVQKCLFGEDFKFNEIKKESIVCTSYKDKKSTISQDKLGGKSTESNPLQLIKKDSPTSSSEVILSDVVEFFVFDEYMAVAVEVRGQLFLYMSKDGEKFNQAKFPPNVRVDKQAYTILQSTTGAVFLDSYKSIEAGSEYGTLFKSNGDGELFSLSLDNTNRNSLGNVDFEKVQGIEGIILANQVENTNELGTGSKKKIKTLISFNDGATWQRIRVESPGCLDQCYLNLHGRTTIHGVGNIFSAPSAIGLLMGVGNIGPSLLPYTECNTYLSRDGGSTWTEVRRGESLYEFGDQGTIMVIVDDEAPTTKILYSWNYGKTWSEYKFSNVPVRVSLLTTNSKSSSMKFILTGHTTPTSARQAQPVVVTIDFSQLEDRKCILAKDGSDHDDFELWWPTSGSNECILGLKTKYWRRKPDKKCRIGDLEDTEIVTSMTTFESIVMDYIYFSNNETIAIRTLNNEVWISYDQGFIWKMPSFMEKGVNIVAMFQNPYFKERAYFITYSKEHYMTIDSGANFIKLSVEMNPNLLQIPVLDFHPVKPDWLIYTGSVDCESILSPNCHAVAYYTTTNGQSWTELNKYVKVCTWARDAKFKTSDTLIFCESYLEKSGSQFSFINNPLQLISSTDYFRSENKLFDNIIGLATFEEYMVAFTVLESTTHSIILHVTTSSLMNNQWGNILKSNYNRTYHSLSLEHVNHDVCGFVDFEKMRGIVGISMANIVGNVHEVNMGNNKKLKSKITFNDESTTHSIILHVTTSSLTNNQWGNILKSNYNGTYYSLSLEHVNRDVRGFVDFEKMRGIVGISMANIVGNVHEVNMGNNKKLKSKITFNDGNTWSFLNPPKEDANGRKYECNDCNLHLHSYTERRDPRDAFSSSTAVGLMMGVGNVGDYLTPYSEGNTYLTNDAGFTWREVKKGAYMYEFGDQGAIIVIMDDKSPTDHVLYSFDEGQSWSEFKFSTELVRVRDIATVPGGISRRFILRGSPQNNYNKEVIIHLNFEGKLSRKCKLDMNDDENDDFVLWYPTHIGGSEKCLFGPESGYHHRIVEKNCYIGNELIQPKTIDKDCVCTMHDFECDYNYVHKNGSDKCELFPGAQPLAEDPNDMCSSSDHYYKSIGYRKVKMSSCKGGEENYMGEKIPCPGRIVGSTSFWVFFIIVIFISVGITTAYLIYKNGGGSRGHIRLGDTYHSSGSILSTIKDIFYSIRVPRSVSRFFSKLSIPGFGSRSANRYNYSPVSQDESHQVSLEDYDNDN